VCLSQASSLLLAASSDNKRLAESSNSFNGFNHASAGTAKFPPKAVSDARKASMNEQNKKIVEQY